MLFCWRGLNFFLPIGVLILKEKNVGTQSNQYPQGCLPTASPTLYFKLAYIGHFSFINQ